MSRSASSSLIASLSLVGRVGGEVRRLDGFDKKRHTVPDQVNGATQAFLAKLCLKDIEEEAERLFQSCRRSFGYKRRDLSLSSSPGSALLESSDFALELRCDLDPEEPSRYYVESELMRAASRDLVESDVFAEAVGPRFDRLRCAFGAAISVDAVIDAIEDDASGELSVEFPSDCSHCRIAIEGIEAMVVVDGQRLELRFPRPSTGASLMAAYDEMGRRFSMAPALSALRGEW